MENYVCTVGLILDTAHAIYSIADQHEAVMPNGDLNPVFTDLVEAICEAWGLSKGKTALFVSTAHNYFPVG